MITILAVGKKHESWVTEGIRRYEERLKKPFDTKWILLPHSSKEGLQARQEESEAILKRLNVTDFVILLDEIGKNIDSIELSSLLHEQFTHSVNVICIIGGAYGVNSEVQGRADFVWSLSKLVFPHQLVRLLVVEQSYRAQEITAGGKYHHQ